MDKRPIPMNQKEKSVKMEVGFIKKNLNDIKYQIDEVCLFEFIEVE